MSNRTEESTVTADAVEAHLRGAIAEAAANIEAFGQSTPENLTANAEEAASCANSATAWTNVVVGLIAGLERFRLAHDKVAGAGPMKPPGMGDPDDQLRQLLRTIKDEAAQGASPTRIEQLIAESGIFVAEE